MSKTRILILGGGFGGLYVALRLNKTLARDPNCEVTLVDKQNFTLFTPMLHEVAASDLDPTDIVNPFRKMLPHINFYEAAVDKIDLETKSVTICYGLARRSRTLQYDHLVIALGAETKFFNEETRTNSVQMKSLGDAIFLRNRMIGLLEGANAESDPDLRSRLMRFVVAGGGFAGVESIGAMNDFLHNALKYYPNVPAELLKVILVHPGKVLLPEFSESLGHYTETKLREAGIEVRLNTKVDSFDGQTVKLKPEADANDKSTEIQARTLLWTAGVSPPKIIESLPGKKEKGRLVVENTMQLAGYPGVWAVGDSAAIPGPDGKPYPTTAQHATREGTKLAKNIEAAVAGRPLKPFTFKILGQLAAIGQRKGTANVLGIQFSGFPAWFFWRTVYLSKLPGIEKKIRVGLSWALDLVFSRDLVQMITIDDIQRLTMLGVKYKLVPDSQDHEEKDGQKDGQHHDDGQKDGHQPAAMGEPASNPRGAEASVAPHHPLDESSALRTPEHAT